MPHDLKACLLDALTAAKSIQAFCAGQTYPDYASSRLLRAGVEREFEIVGEALNRLGRIDPDLLSAGRRDVGAVAPDSWSFER